ncbi:hypothetical protein C1H46_007652 [Malus baccata]|uniref:Uncharacterized protein n=1 Tax=Malus baccata TaxID=106549 RepID=A0A540N897_MALBA|nr:hypothetical protein C1H46_007652 [Malus baccata]
MALFRKFFYRKPPDGLLEISESVYAKCLYDAIARMERAAEKGKAIAAAVEGVEKHWGTSGSG